MDRLENMDQKVAVIGAGYAGIAAAFRLARAGIAVTVFESSKILGGRARRVSYQGVNLDNGQHILLGAYLETLRFVEEIGAADSLEKMPLKLEIENFSLKAFPLPSPFHLLFALLFAKGLSLAERLSAVRFMSGMKAKKFSLEEDISVQKLLRRQNQSENLVRFLWMPLCVSALNTPVEKASAQVFLHVIRDSLFAKKSASEIFIAKKDLSSFPEKAAAIIEKNGGKIHLSSPVRSISLSNQDFLLETDSGSMAFTHVICAVPPNRIPSLVKNFPELDPVAQTVELFEYQPIYTAYLQYPPNFSLPDKMMGSLGLGQWFFDKGRLCRQNGLIAAVISAEGAHQGLSHEEMAHKIHEQLATISPNIPNPLWSKIIAEKKATFSCTPNLRRPGQITPLKNFYLAGDYTQSDYPATLESAIASGFICAKNIFASIS